MRGGYQQLLWSHQCHTTKCFSRYSVSIQCSGSHQVIYGLQFSTLYLQNKICSLFSAVDLDQPKTLNSFSSYENLFYQVTTVQLETSAKNWSHLGQMRTKQCHTSHTCSAFLKFLFLNSVVKQPYTSSQHHIMARLKVSWFLHMCPNQRQALFSVFGKTY